MGSENEEKGKEGREKIRQSPSQHKQRPLLLLRSVKNLVWLPFHFPALEFSSEAAGGRQRAKKGIYIHGGNGGGEEGDGPK